MHDNNELCGASALLVGRGVFSGYKSDREVGQPVQLRGQHGETVSAYQVVHTPASEWAYFGISDVFLRLSSLRA